jgi:hypothetical protein
LWNERPRPQRPRGLSASMRGCSAGHDALGGVRVALARRLSMTSPKPHKV